MDKIQYLFYFSSPELSLLETKRTDMPVAAAMSDVYKWLIYFNATGKFVSLTFINMVKEKDHDLRGFAEADLKFDSEKATLDYGKKSYELVKKDANQIPPELQKATAEYLFSLV